MVIHCFIHCRTDGVSECNRICCYKCIISQKFTQIVFVSQWCKEFGIIILKRATYLKLWQHR